jgi:hypothetical protein
MCIFFFQKFYHINKNCPQKKINSIKNHIFYERQFASFHYYSFFYLSIVFPSVVALGSLEPSVWISLMTWVQLSLSWIWEDTNLEDFLEELRELTTFFPLSTFHSGIVVLILFLACEYLDDQVM